MHQQWLFGRSVAPVGKTLVCSAGPRAEALADKGPRSWRRPRTTQRRTRRGGGKEQAGGHWFEPSTAHHRKAPVTGLFSNEPSSPVAPSRAMSAKCQSLPTRVHGAPHDEPALICCSLDGRRRRLCVLCLSRTLGQSRFPSSLLSRLAAKAAVIISGPSPVDIRRSTRRMLTRSRRRRARSSAAVA